MLQQFRCQLSQFQFVKTSETAGNQDCYPFMAIVFENLFV